MLSLSRNLLEIASTCRTLPRTERFADDHYSGVHLNLTGILNDPGVLGDALAHFDRGNAHAAWMAARPLVAAHGGAAALIGGALALKAGDTLGGISALETLLAGPTVVKPVVDGAVVLAFSDEGMLVFDVNSMAGVALLVYAYAVAGRPGDAVSLAAQAHGVTGAGALLVLQLWLLRDEERWEEVLQAAEAADPDDYNRFEVALLRGQALEALRRRPEARSIYAAIAHTDADLPWTVEAKRRLQDLDDVPPPQLPAHLTARETSAEASAPQPPADPPALSMSAWSLCDLDPHQLWDIEVWVYGSTQSRPADRWVPKIGEGSADEALARLEAAPNAEWKPALEALLAAAAKRPDAAARLASVIVDPQHSRLVEHLSRWSTAGVVIFLGEAKIAMTDGADVFVLALAARLHADGQTEAARAWVSWARTASSGGPLALAATALALASGDSDAVLSETSRRDADPRVADVMNLLRGRALEQTGMTEAALTIYDDALGRAMRLGDDGIDQELAVRFTRARLLVQMGQRDRARRDLYAIQAKEHDYYGVDELLGSASQAEVPQRGRPDREMRRAVFEEYGGRCAECGSTFDLQYDHIIPVALGGATSVENLQILCGECNQRKGNRL